VLQVLTNSNVVTKEGMNEIRDVINEITKFLSWEQRTDVKKMFNLPSDIYCFYFF
jgi:hypothetical protein